MQRWRRTLWLVGLLVPLGCTADTLRVEEHQERVIEGADADLVLAAALPLFQREFGRVQVDRLARRIVTQPVEFTTERESGTARDLYRGKSTMRRKADFLVGRRGGAIVARLKVDVERRDTERQVVLRPRPQRLGDSPGQETALETDGATTGEQNAVWTRVRRDRRLERELLDELRDQCARLTAAVEPASQPQDRARGG
jgi:hypothetical protein